MKKELNTNEIEGDEMKKYKHKTWSKEVSIIKLKPGWKEEMIKALSKYDLPYKSRIRDLEKAILNGEAKVVS
jgi:hypothetical protein